MRCRAVVNLKTYVPADAFTAGTLGTERAGSGVVIRESGLVATIGYLITEAETIWITSADGRAIPGHALAYDQESGFGLVQALGRLNLPALEMGDSDRLKVGDQVVFAAGGGRHHSVETRVVGRQEFAGYWEYVLDDAIFTAPAHPFWGGGGPDRQRRQADGDRLADPAAGRRQGEPARHEHGRADRPADADHEGPAELRPGESPGAAVARACYATEADDTIVVGGVADNGPAEQAGVRAGDRILAVSGDEITDLAGLWRRVWASGSAGAEVRLRLMRDKSPVALTVRSRRPASFLKSPKLH